MNRFFHAALALALVLPACAGTVAAPARMASTQSAMRAAREVGAEQNPTAALHLQYAREQYGEADRLSRRGDGERADRVLMRAQADAELSVALARRGTARAAADQVIAQNRAGQ